MMASQDELYLVTGASGYIASHLITQLLDRGVHIRGTVRNIQRVDKFRFLIEYAEQKGAPIPEFVECDLTYDDGWKEAVSGCVGVYHLSSPNPPGGDAMDKQALVGPARDGALRVLRAAVHEPMVKRVVMTSSCVAVTSARPTDGVDKHEFDENDWTNEDVAGAYEYSKTIAEKAAWKWMDEERPHFTLATVLPCYVQGPIFAKHHATNALSSEMMKRTLTRADPMIARMPVNVCHVADVALAHIRCMEVDEAGGYGPNDHRFIVFSKFFWLDELVRLLAIEFEPRGYPLVKTCAPAPLLWVFGLFDQTLKSVVPSIDHYHTYNTTRLRDVLGIEVHNGLQAFIETGNALIELGVVPKREDRSHWVADHLSDKCTLCSKPFSITNRRHHCRMCGSLVCAQCNDNKNVVPERNCLTPVPVCDNCHHK